MSLKIGLLSYRSHPYSGGQGIYVKHLSKALAELGHEVDVISGQPYPELDERVNLVKLPSLNIFEEEDRFRSFKMNYLMNPLSLFEWLSVMTGGFPEPYTYGVRVNRYLKKRLGDYQIIHDNQSLSYALLHIQQNFPLVTTIHHPITRDHKLELENAKNWKQRLSSNRWHGFLRMQKKVAPSLKAIITPSHSSKIDISNEFSVNKDFIDVVHNGIDTETFKPNDNKNRIKNRIITTASADVPLKGLKYLINALPKIISLYPDTELVVIGKAKNNGETMKLIKKLNLLPHIHFKSNLKEEDIIDLYASAELAVIPSLYEGFGFGAGEAMSCGVPLISTLSGGLKDIVKGSCYEIEPGSSVQIENAVIDLFDNEEEMKRVALLGRKRILEKFNWRQAAKGYLAIYEREITRFSS